MTENREGGAPETGGPVNPAPTRGKHKGSSRWEQRFLGDVSAGRNLMWGVGEPDVKVSGLETRCSNDGSGWKEGPEIQQKWSKQKLRVGLTF